MRGRKSLCALTGVFLGLLSSQEIGAATRFRLTADTTNPSCNPAFQSYTHTNTVRRQLKTSDSSTLTTTAQNPDAADHLVAGSTGHVQFVSAPMNSGIAFDLGTNLAKYAVQASEANAANNLNIQCNVLVYSEDCSTLRQTLATGWEEPTELSSLMNRFDNSSTALTATYTTVAGDRLVVEFSVQGTPTASGGTQGHNASFRWGGNCSSGDLPENDTEAGTTFCPWFEFVENVTFQSTGCGTTVATTGAGCK